MTMSRRFWPRGRADQSALAAVGGALALALLIVSPSIGGPAPGDPALFTGDARLDRCGGTEAPVQYVFEIPRTRDYRAYLPAMEPSPLLDLDDPSLVVIFRTTGPFTSSNRTPVPASASGRQVVRDVCIYVGAAGAGQLDFFTGISVAGLRVRAGGEEIVPADS